ncbi:MAG: hypothetical protein V7677_17405 [Motiliproteus sp.]
MNKVLLIAACFFGAAVDDLLLTTDLAIGKIADRAQMIKYVSETPESLNDHARILRHGLGGSSAWPHRGNYWILGIDRCQKRTLRSA